MTARYNRALVTRPKSWAISPGNNGAVECSKREELRLQINVPRASTVVNNPGDEVTSSQRIPYVLLNQDSLLIESLPNQYAWLHRKRGILDVEFCGHVVILR